MWANDSRLWKKPSRYLKVFRDELVHDTDAANVVAVDVDLLRHRLKREQGLTLFRCQRLETIRFLMCEKSYLEKVFGTTCYKFEMWLRFFSTLYAYLSLPDWKILQATVPMRFRPAMIRTWPKSVTKPIIQMSELLPKTKLLWIRIQLWLQFGRFLFFLFSWPN